MLCLSRSGGEALWLRINLHIVIRVETLVDDVIIPFKGGVLMDVWVTPLPSL